MQTGNLLRNCVLFGRMLRGLGVEITPTQMVDLVDSLSHVNIGQRQDFKNSARTVLISRREFCRSLIKPLISSGKRASGIRCWK